MPQHRPSDPLRWLAILGAVLGLALLLCGCTETRAARQAETDKADTVTVSGTAHVPGIGAVPVQLHIERSGSESLREESESHTRIDSAAIAQQISAVVGKSLDALMAKMTGLQPQQPATGLDSLLGMLGGTGAGGAIAYAIREALARRRLESEYQETKRDRDEGWQQAVELAKQVPPKGQP